MPATVQLRIFNPRTGTNTDKGYVQANLERVQFEIDALAGEITGFLEIINGAGKVMEILSPGPKAFTVLKNRQDTSAQIVNRESVMRQVTEFVG